jgi:hypothetical protein
VYDSVTRTEGRGFSRRSCIPGTRTEVLQEILTWAKDTSAECAPIFWLNGLAGTGKTTIAYTVCQTLQKEGRLGASFFCSRQEDDTRKERFIVPTIVHQLASHSSSFARALRGVSPLSARSLFGQIPDMLVKPWGRVLLVRACIASPLVIVLDDIDGVIEENPSFLNMLLDAIQQTQLINGKNVGALFGLKFLITSRPRPGIMHKRQDIRLHEYNLHQPDSAATNIDIRQSLEAQLHEIRDNPLIRVISERAGSLFIYATAAINLAKHSNSSNPLSPSEMLNRLSILRSTDDALLNVGIINDLYISILRDAFFGLPAEILMNRVEIFRAFLITKPSPPETIAELLLVEEDTVIATFNSFYPVLYLRHGAIHSHHSSFRNYVFGRRDSLQSALESGPSMPKIPLRSQWSQHLHLANCCFRSIESRPISCTMVAGSLSQYPGLKYSIQNWSMHLCALSSSSVDRASYSTVVNQLRVFLERSLLFWIAALFITNGNCLEGVVAALHRVQAWSHKVCHLNIANTTST